MRPNRTLILLSLLVFSGGCELAGALIAAEVAKDDEPPGSATLSVVVESASGNVLGHTLTSETLTPTGVRVDQHLQLDLAAGDAFAIQIFVPVESSSESPYLEERGAGTMVQACDGVTCQVADVFGVEVVQTENGRRAFIDGSWNGTEAAEITLFLTEE